MLIYFPQLIAWAKSCAFPFDDVANRTTRIMEEMGSSASLTSFKNALAGHDIDGYEGCATVLLRDTSVDRRARQKMKDELKNVVSQDEGMATFVGDEVLAGFGIVVMSSCFLVRDSIPSVCLIPFVAFSAIAVFLARVYRQFSHQVGIISLRLSMVPLLISELGAVAQERVQPTQVAMRVAAVTRLDTNHGVTFDNTIELSTDVNSMLNDVHLLRHLASIVTMAAPHISSILGYVDRHRSSDADINRRNEDIRTIAKTLERQISELKHRLFGTGNEYIHMSQDGTDCLTKYKTCLKAINAFKMSCQRPQITEVEARGKYDQRHHNLREELSRWITVDLKNQLATRTSSRSAEVQTFDDQDLCKSALQLIRKLEYNKAVEEESESLRSARDETFIKQKAALQQALAEQSRLAAECSRLEGEIEIHQLHTQQTLDKLSEKMSNLEEIKKKVGENGMINMKGTPRTPIGKRMQEAFNNEQFHKLYHYVEKRGWFITFSVLFTNTGGTSDQKKVEDQIAKAMDERTNEAFKANEKLHKLKGLKEAAETALETHETTTVIAARSAFDSVFKDMDWGSKEYEYLRLRDPTRAAWVVSLYRVAKAVNLLSGLSVRATCSRNTDMLNMLCHQLDEDVFDVSVFEVYLQLAIQDLSEIRDTPLAMATCITPNVMDLYVKGIEARKSNGLLWYLEEDDQLKLEADDEKRLLSPTTENCITDGTTPPLYTVEEPAAGG
eukprot:GHVN01013124.1.p1 GENE.GHVN01013124.1~~GHVN01013124.1.p1  ORF type:complete len:727 (+),score=52.10 GHVN01013124.1:119-2299(+)